VVIRDIPKLASPYLNTGDWVQNRTGIKITDKSIELLSLVEDDIETLGEIKI
jgi:UDP-2,3-diacylglucosamine pyrophosphatase LpxH